MKINTLYIILLSLTILSCQKINTEENFPDISRSDNIKLYFKSDFDSTGKMKIITKEISDINSVNKIKELIDYDPFAYIYCTSTGSMSFYKDKVQIISMVFNTSPGQNHIAFNYNGKLIAIKLSELNSDYLESLKN